MELRQVITVAIFMLAAVIMKSTFSDQLVHMGNGGVEAIQFEQNIESEQLLAALPINIFSQAILSKAPLEQIETASLELTRVNPVPGSLIAIVVAVLGLVFVARRSVLE